MENRVIVLARLESGADVCASVKVKGRLLNDTDKKVLFQRMKKVKSAEDVLYYTIRVTNDGKKDNFKLCTYQGVADCVEKIFEGFKG